MSEFDVIVDRSQQDLIKIPNDIVNLYNLRMLYLQGNRIDVIPDDFFKKLSKLTWLDLRDNKLKTIPKSIRGHQRLENLLLSNNQLEALPNELGFVPNLKVLQISNNPLKYPDSNIIIQGTKKICAYLRNQYEKPDTKNEVDRKSGINQSEINKLTMKNKSSNTCLSIDQAVIPLENKLTHFKEIIHNMATNESRIRLKSSYSFSDDKSMKNMWMDKMKVLLTEQEKILQQEKNLQSLTDWRYNRKTKSVPKLRQEPPYAISTEPEPLQKQSSTINIDDLINNLGEQLQQIENLEEKSERNNIEAIGQQIKAIMTIHKKLKQIKSNPI